MKDKANTAAAAPEEKEEKKSSKALNTIINVLVILVVLFGIFCSFTAFISKAGDGVPSFFGVRPFSIQSDSMSPFFNKGDLIIDMKVNDYSELQVGDVITFWTVINGERVLNSHRIIEINDYETYLSFTTKGDANTIADSLSVHQSEIVGKYRFHIPKLGSFIDFLQTSTGFLVVIVIPCALFFIWQLISFFKSLFAYQAEKTKLKYEAEIQARMQAMGITPQGAHKSATGRKPGPRGAGG